ncbi:MAG: ribosome small subunit-dependent GTPase A [Lautropia sp.]
MIAAYGRHFLLHVAPDEPPLKAVSRARRSDCVVGDQVRYSRLNSEQAVIESVLPRSNRVTRSDNFRTKTIAANLDLAGIVISGYPRFDEALLIRILIALEAEQIPSLLIATKQDLDIAREAMASRQDVYRSLGYPVVTTAAMTAPASLNGLAQQMRGKRTLLLGESGMGKSTLLNALVAGAEQQTAAISEALGSGRHTTTFTRAFALPEGGWLVDSPGFQTFEIAHLSRWQVVHAMPEYLPLLGQCRFNDCRHGIEPGCAIRSAAQNGSIDALRYKLFTEIASA